MSQPQNELKIDYQLSNLSKLQKSGMHCKDKVIGSNYSNCENRLEESNSMLGKNKNVDILQRFNIFEFFVEIIFLQNLCNFNSSFFKKSELTRVRKQRS